MRLFREEVYKRYTTRLAGEVSLAAPISTSITLILTAMIVTAIFSYCFLATHTDYYKARGELKSVSEPIILRAPRDGFVAMIYGSKGRNVHPGDAAITMEAATEAVPCTGRGQNEIMSKGGDCPPVARWEEQHLAFAVGGEVTEVFTERWQRVSTAEPLIAVSPDNTLVAEVVIPPEVRTFIHLGDRLNIQYDEYPAHRFGRAHGAVIDLTARAKSSATSRAGHSLLSKEFVVTIALEDQNRHFRGRAFELAPGAQLTVDVPGQRKTVAAWIAEGLVH